MLKNKTKLFLLIITFIVLASTFSFATSDPAVNPISQNTVSETNTIETNGEQDITTTENEEPEIYNDNLYLFNDNVVMNQLVDGNVYIVGQNVEITGKVNGSLFVIADKVTFSKDSYIMQSIYVCANELYLNGAANDLYAIANKVDMSYDSFMLRDLYVTANSFNFNGGAGRNAFVSAKDFNFVNTEGSAAIVYGNLTYTSSNELTLSNNLVQGEIKYSKYEDTLGEKSVQDIILDYIVDFLKVLLYTVAVFLLALWLAPKFVEKSSSFIGKKSAMALGIGIISFVLAIVISICLLFSVIAIPLGFAIFVLFMLMLSIAFAVTAICITNKVKEKFKFNNKYSTALTLILVTLILWALEQIPYVGFVVSIIVSLIGFGITLLYLFTKNKKDETVVKE